MQAPDFGFSPTEREAGTALVAQWLRICLAKNTSLSAGRERSHMLRVCAATVCLYVLSPHLRACELQLLKPVCLKPRLCNRRRPCSMQLEKVKPTCSNEDPVQPKINKA